MVRKVFPLSPLLDSCARFEHDFIVHVLEFVINDEIPDEEIGRASKCISSNFVARSCYEDSGDLSWKSRFWFSQVND